jgi:hypothetical protein
VKIRGAGLKSLLQAIEKVHGREKLESVRQAVPKHLREQIEPSLLPVQWYPVEINAAVHVAVRDVLGGGKWDEAHRLGIAAARIDFGGIYRVFVRAVSYETIWDRAPRIWSQYNSQGSALWNDRRDDGALGIIRGAAGYNQGLWQSVAGRMEGMLTMTGLRAVNVSVVESSSTYCRLQAMWIK